MRKKGKRTISLLLLAGVMAGSVSAGSALPAESFTHWDLANGQKKAVYMRDVYEPVMKIDARSLGLEDPFYEIRDIDCDNRGNTYLLSDDGRFLSIDIEGKLIKEWEITDSTGAAMDFSGARGIYTPTPDEVFIADTLNNRVLWCDGTGRLIREIGTPQTELLPSDFVFNPVKVERDSKGFLYVISEGAYYGAILYDAEGRFSGFYGANTVRSSALSTISYLWDLLLQNDVKRGKAVKTLPYQFVDICIGPRDFVYTCTGLTGDGGKTGQIRMLSPGGTNILYKQLWNGNRISADSFNFGETDYVKRQNKEVRQNFIEIQADADSFIYALDQTYGLIYLYDTDCNLITAFGGGRDTGSQLGVFSRPCAMALSEDRILIADSLLNTITVFEKTDYGKMLLKAQKLTLNADYEASASLWEDVLSQDANNRLALRGLGKAAYSRGDYAAAMMFAEQGMDSVTYSQALEKAQSDFISRNFTWLFLAVLAAIGATAFLLVLSVKRRMILIPQERVRILVGAVAHPFKSAQEIKYNHKGSLFLAAVMTVLFYLSSVAAATWSNFRYTSFDSAVYNSLFQLLQTAGLIVLWTMANWSISVLQQGKGKLKEVFIITAYSTLPLVIYNLLATILSHCLSSPNSSLLSGLHLVALILTGILLAVGLITIHEFSFARVLFTAVLSILFMFLIVFILFMIGMLLSQFWTFIATVFMEALNR